MTPIGDITVRQLVELDADHVAILSEIVSGLRDIEAGVGGGTVSRATDHFLRRIFHDGSGFTYDPGDEPAIETVDDVLKRPRKAK